MPKPASDLTSTEIKPAPELEKRTRRVFSTEYKLSILSQADACQHQRQQLKPLTLQQSGYSSLILR